MADIDNQRIGERVRYYRKERGLTLKELANRLNVHFTTVGKMEYGKINFTYEKIAEIADVLKVNIGSLLSDRYADVSPSDIPVYPDLGIGADKHPKEFSREIARLPVLAEMDRDLDDCFALFVAEQGAMKQFRFGHWFLAIDPNAKQIEDGGLYAIKRAGSVKVSFVTFRLSVPSICCWPSGREEPLGSSQFDIIGQVFYQARTISPVSGPALKAYEAMADLYPDEVSTKS